MRVAAIYDIHGNLPALEGVLLEIRQEKEKVDHIVVGGDVLPGPMPRETLDRLRDLDTPTHFIYGNGEVAVLQQIAGKEPSAEPQAFRPIIRWTAEQLHPEHQQWLSSWPKTLTLEIVGLGPVLFCHATPQNENDIFTLLTPEAHLLPIFEGLPASIIVCGHTHMQFDRTIGRTRIVNAGSVGMPFGKPGAHWLLLGPDIHFRHTTYDLANAAEQIRSTAYPQAHDFAARNILNPPTEQEMLEIFNRAASPANAK
jgi:diadenosine tetraphosphatase ApaH/serine/threonine PP2A family protein phosphatase